MPKAVPNHEPLVKIVDQHHERVVLLAPDLLTDEFASLRSSMESTKYVGMLRDRIEHHRGLMRRKVDEAKTPTMKGNEKEAVNRAVSDMCSELSRLLNEYDR